MEFSAPQALTGGARERRRRGHVRIGAWAPCCVVAPLLSSVQPLRLTVSVQDREVAFNVRAFRAP
jgi:hypothetical protein